MNADDAILGLAALPEGNVVLRVGTLLEADLSTVTVELGGTVISGVPFAKGITWTLADINDPVWLLQTQTALICIGRPA